MGVSTRRIRAGRATRWQAWLGAAAAVALVLVLPGQALAAPPSNDDFADAIGFAPVPGTVVGSNVDATEEGGEPLDNEAGALSTVWWKWTATESGRFRLDTCQTTPEYDSTLNVFLGTAVNSLTEVPQASKENCGPSGSFSDLNVTNFDAVAGTTYYFQVGSDDFGFEESQNIRLSLRRTPLNDNFAAAFAFNPVPGTVVGTNAEATIEDGEPTDREAGVLASIWWKWTATKSGRYRLDTCLTTPEFDSTLSVFRGAAVNQLLRVPEIDPEDCGPYGSFSDLNQTNFDAVAGATYYFQVGSDDFGFSTSDNIRLRLVSHDCLSSRGALEKAKKKLKRAKKKLKRAKKKLKRAKKSGKKQLKTAKKQLKTAKKQLKTAKRRRNKAVDAVRVAC